MAAEAEAAAENSDGTVGGEVIEVTGSLVDRKTLDTPAPVSVVDREIMQASGLTNVGDILQKLPSQSNAINANFNNGGDGSTRINLRGLGANRTLVLMNGRRIVPGGTGADSSVDLAVIPIAAIERIEILKDGASAIYGSDAIGGVVNVITRSDFKGTEVTGYTGLAQASGSKNGADGQTYDVSVATGTASSKGSIMMAAQYSQTQPIFAGDREFGRTDLDFDYTATDPADQIVENGSGTIPEGRIKWKDGQPDTGNALWDSLSGKCASGFCVNDGMGGYRNYNGGGNSDSGKGDLYNFQPENYLVTPLRRYNVFADGTYHFNSHVNGKIEMLYVNRKSNQSLAPEPLVFDSFGVTISKDSIYNPFERNVYVYRRRFLEGGDRLFKQNVDTFRTVVGLEGDIPEDAPALKNWKWDVSYNYGRTQAISINQGNLILSHLANAVGPSFIDPDTGTPTCGSPGAPGPADCVPLNILGPASANAVTPEMLKYLQYTGVGTGFNDQKTMLAQAHGQVAKTPWGGDVAVGVGADYRQEAGGSQSEPLAATGDSTNGANAPTAGKYNVAEAFAELSIVPVTNRKLAKYVEIDGAIRGFNYSTFGSGTTWKVGALYKIPQGISLRGTYSTAFRAPSIADLYSGAADSFPEAVDPCDNAIDEAGVTDPIIKANCAADGVPADLSDGSTQLRSTVGGSTKVKPEKAKVLTAGIVVEPEKVKGLSVTLDYFNADITNAITSLGVPVILSQCYTRGTGDQRQNCDLIKRNPVTHTISIIDDRQTNVGGNKTSGLDYAISYDRAFDKPGRFRINIEGTYLFKYNLITGIGTIFGRGVYDLGVFPRLKNNVSLIWGKGNLGAGATVRYIQGFKECDGDDCAGKLKIEGTATEPKPWRDVNSNTTMDLFVTYGWKNLVGRTSVSAGVNNVADTKPPFIYAGFLANSDASTYDYMGRFFYVRASQSF
ncbi:MAG: TonB-dependent receptor [Deltaproteobacteria bacterium]|nr:TonB-dependent receptor [Deltaproteobacteria bacterium]